VTEGDIADLLTSLGTAPLGLTRGQGFRISVAGAQAKTTLLRWDGAWVPGAQARHGCGREPPLRGAWGVASAPRPDREAGRHRRGPRMWVDARRRRTRPRGLGEGRGGGPWCPCRGGPGADRRRRRGPPGDR